MKRITEQNIENFAYEVLVKLGYEYIYAPEISLDVNIPENNGTFSGNNL